MKSLSAALLAALASMQVHAQAQKKLEPLRAGFQNRPWVLQMDAPGFVVKENGTKADGRRYLLAESDSSGSALSITLESVTGRADLDGCRQELHGRTAPGGPFKLAQIKESQIGGMAVLEYMIPVANGAPVNQKNLFACLAKDDVYADIHISKIDFKEKDELLLNAILSSARFVELDKDANLLFGEGSVYYLRQDYEKAIGPYRRALDLEKQTPKLDKARWRVLIDNLAMAYGITGKLDMADEVLKYGASKDPAYPMFYFVMADNSAERNDFDNTMKFLRLALEFRGNVNAGEKLPDPLTDDSFRRFYQNPEFRDLASQFR
ncbi:MAG TPA: hypothetical protein VH639_26615 [Bryobacteraceae bacterium]